MNNAQFFGRLTRDPELKYSQNGLAIANFALAINEKFFKDGETRENTTFVDFDIFGKQAEALSKYVKRGDQLLITNSRVKNDSWEDKETGEKRSRIRFIVNNFEFVGPRYPTCGEEKKEKPARKPKVKPVPEIDEEDDDIPF